MNPTEISIDFTERPYIVIWEVTQACDLACVHCRANAQPNRNSLELSTEEGKRLMDEISRLQVPVLVLTDGDPIKRPDLFELIVHARRVGVRVSLTPSATPLLRRDVMHRLKESGLARLAASLDGSHRKVHDAFRAMSGSFDRTMEAIEWANEIGLPVQINTTFSRSNVEDFDNIAALMETKQIALWSVFFLVPTGRGKIADLLSAEEFEELFAKLLSRIYRESPVFQQLRDDSQLRGKCGACEYRRICGGSRARACSLTGDPLAEEPCCAYVPKNFSRHNVLPPQWRRPAGLHVL